ncbi:hypothetical protein LOTGIDRAFT_229635 [Lottia gigantea]|uniref:Uncharacterized protein n=1 Tax=Lottia gigantea TaxID=225164 RepID=V4B6J0_LOTGI|nr:hypothetical protein LOTGIDRAFT_229635 [Lottia gigantea]ESO84164.1 hypothetical protein LOTGIDRAFT_229635 [Lottia gigantea]
MTSNGSQDVKLSTNIIESVKETVQAGTAKLLIDPDGTVRLEANSNFPTPGTHDKQKLFAACTDDGQTNVYYSPSGNPSEVYLLKPTAKSAGKQLRLTTRDSKNIKASTAEDQPYESDQDKSNPIVMSVIGQDTVAQKPSSLSSSQSLSKGGPSTATLSPPSVCSIATSTSSSPVNSPVDDSDFPIDLPVSFETDVKNSGVNSDIDELDSLLPDIGSTIAAHLQNKDSQQNTVSRKENIVKTLLTQKTPVTMPHTATANNASVKIPMSYKNIATKPVPITNSNGQLLLFTTSIGQNQCIYLSENEKLAPVVPDIAKSIPTIDTNSSAQPMANAFSLLQSSFKQTRTTAPFKPLNAVSLLHGPVQQKTLPRILNVSNHPQTKPVSSSKQTSVPIIVMPKSMPATSSYMAKNITQKHVPVKVLPKAAQAVPNTNVTQVNSENVSGLKFVSSNTSDNFKQFLPRKINPESIMKIGKTTASQCLEQAVAKTSGSTSITSVVACPKVSNEELVVCENVNNHNNIDGDNIKKTEDTSCNIRIDSVFSLSEPSQSEENTKKDGKRKRKNANKDKKFKFVTEVKEYKCKPMYVVLERLALSKDTVHVHDDTLSKTKCTNYCRKRTLNCLCDIDLLDCKNPVLSSTATYMKRRRIEITPSSPELALELSDSDLKSRCADDWTLVEEVPKETSTIANKVHKPSIQNTDHSSYASPSEAARSRNFKSGNKPKMALKAVTMLPAKVTTPDSKVHSTQQAFEGALKNAVASKNVLNNSVETKPLLQNMPTLIKIPLTISSTKPSNSLIVTGTASSSTTTTTIPSVISSTTPSLSKVSPTPAHTQAKEKVLNGKFYLVTIDGKMVLIPTDKSVNNKAFVLQQAADGTTGLIPACLSYSKTTPTAPINTTASPIVTSVSSSKSVMNIRSIAPRTNSSLTLASNTNTSAKIIPTGPGVPKTIQSPIQSITAAIVSKPQPVSIVPNAKLAATDTMTKSPVIQATIACPSNTGTPSPTVDPAKKRKKTLAERYPLPPGVIIKQEPRTTGYGDEPKDQGVESANPSPLPVTSNRRLVQSVLTPSVVPRLTSTSTLLTLPTTTVNSRSLLRNTTPIQGIGSFNRSIPVPATNLRTLNIPQPNTQSTKPRPPINIIQYFPVSKSASHHVQAPPRISPVMKNNTITFTKLPNTNAFQAVTTKIHNSSIPSKTLVNAKERPIPVLFSREPRVDNKLVENNSRPGSPGPPDLGEPQIILPPKVGQQVSNDSDTDSDTEGASNSFPLFTSPVVEKRLVEPKAKTPQELRIEKLKKQLREQERALEEMRKKKALECPIDIDDD